MVPEGEYILNKVEVKSDSAEYDAGALKQYVRQKEKPKLFALFKNPFSKKPVIYDSIQARLTCQEGEPKTAHPELPGRKSHCRQSERSDRYRHHLLGIQKKLLRPKRSKGQK